MKKFEKKSLFSVADSEALKDTGVQTLCDIYKTSINRTFERDKKKCKDYFKQR